MRVGTILVDLDNESSNVVSYNAICMLPFLTARWNPKMLSKHGASGSVTYTAKCTVKVPTHVIIRNLCACLLKFESTLNVYIHLISITIKVQY